MTTRRTALRVTPVLLLVTLGAARAYDVVLNAQGEYVDAYLVNGEAFPPRVVFDDPDPADPGSLDTPPRVGRHLNGPLCFFPKGVGRRGQFVMADDTYREACVDRRTPQARCSVTRRRSPFFVGTDPDGWGIFRRNGKWTRQHLHTPWDVVSEPPPQGNRDPQGCVFHPDGRLFLNDVGSGAPGAADGALLVFFPGRRNRYREYCFVDRALAAPGIPAMDEAGNLYVPEPAAARLTRFAPPFPSSPEDCDNPQLLVTTPPTKSVFLSAGRPGGLSIPISIVRVPGTDHWYVGGVLGPTIINEYDANGAFIRNIVPAGVPKNPLGMDVGSDGTLYYAELNLDPATFDTRCGSVSMVKFDAQGAPQLPLTLGQHLRFPDGVTVVDSKQLAVNFRNLPRSPDLDPSQCGGE